MTASQNTWLSITGLSLSDGLKFFWSGCGNCQHLPRSWRGGWLPICTLFIVIIIIITSPSPPLSSPASSSLSPSLSSSSPMLYKVPYLIFKTTQWIIWWNRWWNWGIEWIGKLPIVKQLIGDWFKFELQSNSKFNPFHLKTVVYSASLPSNSWVLKIFTWYFIVSF